MEGRDTGNSPLPQRAKVRYCPCCTVPSQVAVPPSFQAGVCDPLKKKEADLLAQFGPWAGRRLAAFRYAEYFGNSTKEWDRAANGTLIATQPALSSPPAASEIKNAREVFFLA